MGALLARLEAAGVRVKPFGNGKLRAVEALPMATDAAARSRANQAWARPVAPNNRIRAIARLHVP